jgi:flagellin
MTRESRESLLGVPPDKGTLDKGLDYLIDANTLIGAQVNRLQNSNANITTNLENTQASESVIRDADMAKAMTSLIRSNILSQSAQAMLAQANQQGSSVLNLLQG